MELEQIRAARRELEDEIRISVHDAVAKFREKTGISPEGIFVDMVDVTEIGDREKRFSVGKVSARVPL